MKVVGDQLDAITDRGTEWHGIIVSVKPDYYLIRQARGIDNRPGVARVYRDGLAELVGERKVEK